MRMSAYPLVKNGQSPGIRRVRDIRNIAHITLETNNTRNISDI
jgi:hypothetical protein